MTDDDMLGPPEPAAWLVDPPAPEPMVIASLLIDVCQHHSAGKHIEDNLIQNNQDTHFQMASGFLAGERTVLALVARGCRWA